MRKLENEELLKEFHALKQLEFPGIDIKQAKEIVDTPWRYLKQLMEGGDLLGMRMKYFGTFRVYLGRAKHMLEHNKERFKLNKISKEEFYRIKNMLEKYIKNEETNLEKH